ncbi:MAG TPA: hypothetical protein ENN41_08425 [Sediminispirochaeta sp.]|nr:hypothetical protein [Sediminispirochaeta sp.]
MTKQDLKPRETSTVTCIAHSGLRKDIIQWLERRNIDPFYIEIGKNARQLIRPRPFGLPGTTQRLHESPVELFRFNVAPEQTRTLMSSLLQSTGLEFHGRGILIAQEGTLYSGEELAQPADPPTPHPSSSLLSDLTVITCILSTEGSAEKLSRIALELGTCVPVVTNGRGTGMRDYLGLLRITIPPEKEVVHLVVPEHDADSIIKLLIEEAKLNLPGRGFLYRSPVSFGLVDTILRIGHQSYAASIEQIISAIDELKAGTHWRKRFTGLDRRPSSSSPILFHDYQEIVFTCREGQSDALVKEAIQAGASGATVSRVTKKGSPGKKSDTAARERGIICVPRRGAAAITDALLNVEEELLRKLDQILIHDAPTVYTHTK